MFLHYINTKQKHIKVFFLPNENKYPHQVISTSTPLAHSPHPLRCSFSTSLHPLIYSIRQRRENAHETVSKSASPSTVPVFKFKFLYYAPHVYIMVCFKKETYSEKYEWESLLLLSELSISALPSHSCLHVHELYTTQTDRQTQTHTHTHTITRMFQSF